jgi:plastocyanin
VFSTVAVAVLVMAGSAGMCDAEGGTAKIVVNTGVQEFTPQRLTIQVGDRVMWVNHDRDTHSLVSAGLASRQAASGPDALLINTTLPPGASYAHTFVESGTYYYFCANHEVWGIVVAEQ